MYIWFIYFLFFCQSNFLSTKPSPRSLDPGYSSICKLTANCRWLQYGIQTQPFNYCSSCSRAPRTKVVNQPGFFLWSLSVSRRDNSKVLCNANSTVTAESFLSHFNWVGLSPFFPRKGKNWKVRKEKKRKETFILLVLCLDISVDSLCNYWKRCHDLTPLCRRKWLCWVHLLTRAWN